MDVVSGSLREDVVVLVERDRIVDVLPSGEFAPSAEVLAYDARGLFLLPGLIDMHVHATHCPSIALADRQSGSATTMGIHAVANLRESLMSGITTVRDVGSGLDTGFAIKRAWRKGFFQGSRPFVSGPMLTAIGGHGTEPSTRIGVEVCGSTEIRREVRLAAAKGADLIKIATCGGSVRTELSLEEIKAAVEEAHWSGLRVASHAHFELRSVKNSVVAKCDTIEHGCILDNEVIDLMVRQETFLCPTITVFARIIEHPDAFGGRDSRFVQKVLKVWDIHRANLGKAYSSGVHIIAGTDAGMPFVTFDALHDELEWMVKWGIAPLDAVRACTWKASLALGTDDVGRVSKGALADLLFVDENPLRNINAVRNIRAVVQAGVLVRTEGKWSEGPSS